MSIEFFVSRTLRYVSAFAFVIVLLFTYRGLPDYTAVHFNAVGRGDAVLPKEQLFYVVAGIVFMLNILPVILAKNLEKLPMRSFQKLPYKNWLTNEKEFKASLVNWLHFLPTLANVFTIFTLKSLLTLNDERTFNTDYAYLPITGTVALVIWLFYLPAKLSFTNPTPVEE